MFFLFYESTQLNPTCISAHANTVSPRNLTQRKGFSEATNEKVLLQPWHSALPVVTG